MFRTEKLRYAIFKNLTEIRLFQTLFKFLHNTNFENICEMPKRKSKEIMKSEEKKPKTASHWSMGLAKAIEDPELIVKSDDLVVVIKDKYPKAQFHYLVVPVEFISDLKVVTKKHVKLLKHMQAVALEISETHKGSNFMFGYHAEPSMVRLHLHVISDDMNSVCLKTKKHWNSFTTGFFLKSEEIIKNLEMNGKVTLPTKEKSKVYMDMPLKCHKCDDFQPKHLPDLKKHILNHQ